MSAAPLGTEVGPMRDSSSVEPLVKAKFARPVDPAAVARDWQMRGYSCEPFFDPPGREWNDFVHDTNELVTVIEGRLALTMAGTTLTLAPGDEVLIARGVLHSVKNVHGAPTRWLYGYD
jgi:mannose-6-phosphate isomerase-like protein (cupin superfamily)